MNNLKRPRAGGWTKKPRRLRRKFLVRIPLHNRVGWALAHLEMVG